MNDRQDDDLRIEELFRAARRADEASTPPFESVRRASRASKRPATTFGRVVRIAVATSFAGVALAATAWFALVEQTDSPLIANQREGSPVTVRKYIPPPPGPPAPAAKVASAKPSPPDVELMIGTPIEKMEVYRGDGSEMVAVGDVVEMEPSGQSVEFSEGFARQSPVPGRFYQNVATLSPGAQDAEGDGNPNVRYRRVRDFKAIVGGVSGAGSDPAEVTLEGYAPVSTESYDVIRENPFRSVIDHPLSTFSIDVDTASYANVRRFLQQGTRPPADAVRIEEMINYFDYDYPPPAGDAPFSADIEIADCPWNPGHRLARIGLKGREVDRGELRGTNLVFLIDVSGSMQPQNKLPLLKKALRMLVEQLDGRDQIAMVVYAGSSGLVLPSTSGNDTRTIVRALDRLEAGGSTNGGEGLRLAYEIARENFIPGGVNRVILATDGDFNVGITHRSNLLELIKKDADNGIFLTALGVGMGDYKDDTLELLADRGNGNYAYIDSLNEARKVLVEEIGGTLVTIAKDVKIQVEFNPVEVGAYRLIGYENRMLAKEDFNDDTKDAGEIGAGHTVTALYELVPPGEEQGAPAVDPLKYQTSGDLSKAAGEGELFTLKLRYKEPEGTASKLLAFPVVDQGLTFEVASSDFQFASAVAMFGMILRGSPHKGTATLEDAVQISVRSASSDPYGYRAEFRSLVSRAMRMAIEP